MNRDVVSGTGAGALQKNWDGQQLMGQVQAQVEVTSKALPVVTQAFATYADTKAKELRSQGNEAEAEKWDEGGTYRVAGHVAIGALGGGAAGAAGAGASAEAAPLLNQLQDALQGQLGQAGLGDTAAKEVAQLLTGGAAAAIGAATGAQAGALTGVSEDANNRQLHPDERQWAKDNATKYQQYLSDETGENISPEDAYQRLLSAGYAVVDDAAGKTGKSDETAKQFINQNAGSLFTATAAERANPLLSGNADGSYTPEQQARYGIPKPGEKSSAAVTAAMQYVGQSCTDCRAKVGAIDAAITALQDAKVLYQDDPASLKVIDQQIDQIKVGITQDELVRGMAGAISDKDKGIAALVLGGPSRLVVGAGTTELSERVTLTQASKEAGAAASGDTAATVDSLGAAGQSVPRSLLDTNGNLPSGISGPGTPIPMPPSVDPNATAEAFAQAAFGGQTPDTITKILSGKSWVAKLPDGTVVTYQAAGDASGSTDSLTATVQVNSPAVKAINNGEVPKFKFPRK